MGDFVYFIGNDEAVKIGLSNNPVGRRGGIQNGNPKRVDILCTAACEKALVTEKYLHGVFDEWRLEGEWFSHNPKLDFLIEFLNSYMPVPIAEHIGMAFKVFEGSPYDKSWLYVTDSVVEADAAFMCMTDLIASGQTINGSQMRIAIGYYRTWLKILNTLNTKRFKTKVYAPIARHEVESWAVVTPNGKVHKCLNFFYTEEFKQLGKPQPFPQIIGEVQLDLFKNAS